jgi:hypothetical protein
MNYVGVSRLPTLHQKKLTQPIAHEVLRKPLLTTY